MSRPWRSHPYHAILLWQLLLLGDRQVPALPPKFSALIQWNNAQWKNWSSTCLSRFHSRRCGYICLCLLWSAHARSPRCALTHAGPLPSPSWGKQEPRTPPASHQCGQHWRSSWGERHRESCSAMKWPIQPFGQTIGCLYVVCFHFCEYLNGEVKLLQHSNECCCKPALNFQKPATTEESLNAKWQLVAIGICRQKGVGLAICYSSNIA